jgi:hypothetical protein
MHATVQTVISRQPVSCLFEILMEAFSSSSGNQLLACTGSRGELRGDGDG